MPLQFTATVKLGSEKQVAAGILANGIVHVWVDGEHVIDLYDWKVRNFQSGLTALPPQRQGGTDENNKPKYFSIFRVFPNDVNRYREVQNTVIQAYYAQQQNQPQQAAVAPQAAAYQTPTPAQAFPSAGGGAPQAPSGPQVPSPGTFPGSPSSTPQPPQQGSGATSQPSPPGPPAPSEWGYDS